MGRWEPAQALSGGKMFRLKTSNLPLAALILLLALANLPYLAARCVPVLDTMAVFQGFHFFYSEFFHHGHLARWVPYGAFGWQSDVYQLIFFSPANWLLGLAGGILRARDVMFLFKISLFVEQLMFLLGMWLLTTLIFTRRSTQILVSLGAMCGVGCYEGITFDFRIFYLFPLVSYLLISFFTRRRPEHLWLAGVVGVAWVLGNPPYAASLWLFTFSVMGLVFWVKERGGFCRCLLTRSWSNLLSLTLFILVAAAYLCLAKHAQDFTRINTPGRDAVTGDNSLETFLTYGGRGRPALVLKSFLFGWPTHLPWGSHHDVSVYIGLLPLFFFAWSLATVRTAAFLGFAGALVALAWLSLGGWFAALVYHFPMMSYYRHIGHVYGLVKVLLLLCAGFGWESFWSAAPRTRRRAGILAGLVVLTAVLACAPDAVRAVRYVLALGLQALPLGRLHLQSATWPTVLLIRLALYLAAIGITAAIIHRFAQAPQASETPARAVNPLETALIAAFLMDLLSFQLVTYLRMPKLPTSYASHLDAFKVSKLEFQPQRASEPTAPRPQSAMKLITHPGHITNYVVAYSFLQFDPCSSAFRVDWWPAGVARLKDARAADDEAMRRVLGCAAPKLRLVTNALFTDTLDQAVKAVQTTPNLDEVLILRGPMKRPSDAGLGHDAVPRGSLAVTRFTSNEIVISADVTAASGAWLVCADSFHPGWRATVNGQPSSVTEAYLAFKTVWLDKGSHVVRFSFRPGLNSILSCFSGLFGVIFSAVLLVVCARLLRPRAEAEQCRT